MNAIYDLLGRGDYEAKMLHPIPKADVVDRRRFILERARNKIVLDIGATGAMHEAIKSAAKKCHGIDIVPQNDPDHYQIDLDRAEGLPGIKGVELIVAGEVIEHLDNAGHFLDLLKPFNCPVILTTPNAFNEPGRRSILKGVETVNPEHVAYYSYWTLKTLVERHGYEIRQWFWYNGEPHTAEGLIFVLEVQNGTT